MWLLEKRKEVTDEACSKDFVDIFSREKKLFAIQVTYCVRICVQSDICTFHGSCLCMPSSQQ